MVFHQQTQIHTLTLKFAHDVTTTTQIYLKATTTRKTVKILVIDNKS